MRKRIGGKGWNILKRPTVSLVCLRRGARGGEKQMGLIKQVWGIAGAFIPAYGVCTDLENYLELESFQVQG